MLHPDVASMEFHIEVQQANWEETFSRTVTMFERVRVDFYGAMPPESAFASFRQAGCEVGIKPVHLDGFTR